MEILWNLLEFGSKQEVRGKKGWGGKGGGGERKVVHCTQKSPMACNIVNMPAID